MATYRERRPLKHLKVPLTLGVGEGGKTIPQLYDYFLQIDDYIDELKNQSGAGDMTKAVYDTDDSGTVDEAENVSWENVSGKPSSYPPETHNHDEVYAPVDHTHSEYAPTSHNHDIGDVSGLQGALDEKLTALQGAAQADSTATDAAGLVTDFNALLQKLRDAGIIAS